MPQHQHFYLACDLSARCQGSVPLATIEYTLPYSEYRDPVQWDMRREYANPRYHLRELELISANENASSTAIAEQIRSRIFKITRQNQECTLVVDTASQPASELFHHLSPRASVMQVVLTGGSGELHGEEHTRIARVNLLEGLGKMLENGDLTVSEKHRAALGELEGESAVAVALALWQASKHQVAKPEPRKEVQSGWGKVRIL